MEPKTISALLKTSKNYINLLTDNILSFGLNLSEFSVLEALYQKGELAVGDLLDKVLVNNSTVSYTLNKLQKEGYIERRKCQKDGRVAYISLTSAGQTFISEISPQHYAYIETIGTTLNQTEETELRTLLKKLNTKEEL